MAKGKAAKRLASEDAALVTASVQTFLARRNQIGTDTFPIELNQAFASSSIADVRPGAQFTWYFFGRPKSTVKISLRRIPNSGGHIHPGGPIGSIDRTSITLGPHYPQNEPVVFTAPDAAGSIEMIGTFSTGEKTSGTNRVHIPGFVALTGGVGITLTGGKVEHPSNHFGLPVLVEKIKQLGAQFHAKFGKNLFVNDMSLQDGGLYDFHCTWAPPHATHREGRTVDINSTSMSNVERGFFKTAALTLGFRVALENNPEHWHLTI